MPKWQWSKTCVLLSTTKIIHLQLSTSIGNSYDLVYSLDSIPLYLFVIVAMVWNRPLESPFKWRSKVFLSLFMNIVYLFASINKGNNIFSSYSTTTTTFSQPKNIVTNHMFLNFRSNIKVNILWPFLLSNVWRK